VRLRHEEIFAAPALRGKFGVFSTAEEACEAAQESFLQLKQKGIAARRKIEEIVKALAEKNAESWVSSNSTKQKSAGSITRCQAANHQARSRRGLLRPDARSGDTASRWKNSLRLASSARHAQHHSIRL